MTEATLRLRDGETAVIGYGSLLSRASLEQTLKRSYDGPYIACHIEGWRRSWDVAMPNKAFYYVTDNKRIYPEEILYLNVRAVPDARLNVTMFVVSQDEIAAMHEREWIYDPVVVTGRLRGVRLEGGPALMYVAKPAFVRRSAASPEKAAVRASYVRIVEEGLRQRDPLFRAEYAESTDPVPKHLVVEDLIDPDRQNPWSQGEVR